MEKDIFWNPWHGCKKFSEGCLNCYVYRMDAKFERDASILKLNIGYNMPIKKVKGEYKIPSGSMVYTCFSSDFLFEDADNWRQNAWKMIKARSDLHFLFITKRIYRFMDIIPSDWGEGYDNVSVGCTIENQRVADERLPIFLSVPIKHKFIVCAPLLGKIDLSEYLDSSIEEVSVGGESGKMARPCNFDWVLSIKAQCDSASVPFEFKQTGAFFIKEGKNYIVKREFQHSQAKKAGINTK